MKRRKLNPLRQRPLTAVAPQLRRQLVVPSRGLGAAPEADPIAPSALNYIENSIFQGPTDLQQPGTGWTESGSVLLMNRYVIEAGEQWGLEFTGVSGSVPITQILLHFCGDFAQQYTQGSVFTFSMECVEAGPAGAVGPLFSLNGLNVTELGGNHRDKPVPVGERVWVTWQGDSASWVANTRLRVGWANSAWATTGKFEKPILTYGDFSTHAAYYQPTYFSDANIGYRGTMSVGFSSSGYGYDFSQGEGGLDPLSFSQGRLPYFDLIAADNRHYIRNRTDEQLFHDTIYFVYPDFEGGRAIQSTWSNNVQWRSPVENTLRTYLSLQFGNDIPYWRTAVPSFPEEGPDNWRFANS